MSGRYRAVALQAVGVAVLAAIVYLAFLRPSDPDPVMGIKGPDALEQAKTENHEPLDKRPGKHGKENRKPGKSTGGNDRKGTISRQGERRRGGPGGQGLPGPGVVAGQDPGTINPPGGTHGGNPHTPPGSQYQDSVARITSLLKE